jgi:hypothetical protein
MLREYYKWELELDDGRVVNQSPDGEKEQFKFHHRNPDFEKIRVFKLIPKHKDSGLREFKMGVPDGATLIYFRRTIANTGNLFPKFQVNMVGWQIEIGGKKVKQITYLYPDGRIENNYDEPTMVESFTESLPLKDASEIESCTGCEPKLVRADEDGE